MLILESLTIFGQVGGSRKEHLLAVEVYFPQEGPLKIVEQSAGDGGCPEMGRDQCTVGLGIGCDYRSSSSLRFESIILTILARFLWLKAPFLHAALSFLKAGLS